MLNKLFVTFAFALSAFQTSPAKAEIDCPIDQNSCIKCSEGRTILTAATPEDKQVLLNKNQTKDQKWCHVWTEGELILACIDSSAPCIPHAINDLTWNCALNEKSGKKANLSLYKKCEEQYSEFLTENGCLPSKVSCLGNYGNLYMKCNSSSKVCMSPIITGKGHYCPKDSDTIDKTEISDLLLKGQPFTITICKWKDVALKRRQDLDKNAPRSGDPFKNNRSSEKTN